MYVVVYINIYTYMIIHTHTYCGRTNQKSFYTQEVKASFVLALEKNRNQSEMVEGKLQKLKNGYINRI